MTDTRETALREMLDQARRSAATGPHSAQAHVELANILSALGEKMEAVATLRNALSFDGKAEEYEAIGFAAFGLNDHELARTCYRRVVDIAPMDPLAHYNLASIERNLGRLDAAEHACEAALALDGNLFQAALLRSQLRKQTPEHNHVEQLHRILHENEGALHARIFINYALGKELDDLGRFDEAFAHFDAGARSRRAALSYDVESDLTILRRIQQVYTPKASLKTGNVREAHGLHGFIIGLPRSGTTLIERVLTGYADVTSNGETDNFSTALMHSLPPGPGDIFERAARTDPATVGRAYRRLAGEPPSGGRLVLEKLPLNYLYIGPIAAALPDAPIILVRRNPLDTCLAIYTTLFGVAYPFSYDLDELGRYYAAFDRLMAHWKRLLGDRILEIGYEAFVNDPERWGARIAANCGLTWDPAAVRIEENNSPSATASAVQIRQPIYRSAVGRWRNYARHLEPLRQTLEHLKIAT